MYWTGENTTRRHLRVHEFSASGTSPWFSSHSQACDADVVGRRRFGESSEKPLSLCRALLLVSLVDFEQGPITASENSDGREIDSHHKES